MLTVVLPNLCWTWIQIILSDKNHVTSCWLACPRENYCSAIVWRVHISSHYECSSAKHIQLLQEVHLVNSTGHTLYKKTLDTLCLAMPLDSISDTHSITGTGWSAENLMLIHDMPLHYVMAGVWCAMRATRMNWAMCVRRVCKVRKPIPAPSWNIMSKHLILNTIQWTTLCGPHLMEN